MTIRSALAAAGTAALVALTAGCGSGSSSHTSASRPAPPSPTSSGSRLGPAGGRALFAEACEVCHSISGHSRPSQQGGDLRSFHGSLVQLRQLTAEMPVVHHRLTPREITAVVHYVAAIEARRR